MFHARSSGLKKLLKEGEQVPAIYTDPTFAKSSNWVLSTSQLTSEFFEGWGYGEGSFLAVAFATPFADSLSSQLSMRDTDSPTPSTLAACGSPSRA